MATAEKLLTAEEYWSMEPNDRRTELVAGQVIEMNLSGSRHGFVCSRITIVLGIFLEEHPLGRLFCSDSGVVTRRAPDSVRGPDVSFISFSRLPDEECPRQYPNLVPEIVFEVVSPSDRWSRVTNKASEYLEAGVQVVCIADPETRTLSIFRDDRPIEVLQETDELMLPEFALEFRTPVSAFFVSRR